MKAGPFKVGRHTDAYNPSASPTATKGGRHGSS